MSILQKSKNSIFIDYIPAELKEKKRWEIIYYVLNPFSEKLERKRIRVKPLKSVTERRKLAKRMVTEINIRLAGGWNPFVESAKTKEFTKLFDVLNIYLKHITLEYKDNNMRFDTHRTYTSRIKILSEYLKENGFKDMLCYKFNDTIISGFLDYLRYEKNNSARTRDNYMTFINTLCLWMVAKKYLAINSCENFKKINRKKKTRIIIPTEDRIKIFEYYKVKNINYLVMCMTCYYCLVRRTELSKIKVSDVNLKNRTLFIVADDSKSNKSAHVTIPEELALLLKKHIKGSKDSHYLFSDDNYATGTERFKPNKSTSNWRRMRAKLDLDFDIKWYSLKDTGITDLITAGVPLLSVRDQARHQNIKQTDEYTPKGMKKADAHIQNSGVKF
jgi:integrase